jgi:hypothetical protein
LIVVISVAEAPEALARAFIDHEVEAVERVEESMRSVTGFPPSPVTGGSGSTFTGETATSMR